MADIKDSRKDRTAYLRAYFEENRERIAARRRAWRAANPAKNAKTRQKWKKANPKKSQAITNKAVKKWRAANPERNAYARHRDHAKARGIPFLLSFEEWWAIWQESGRWTERGLRGEQYCMARFGDVGPYAIGNVRICTQRENHAECLQNISDETRRRRSESMKAYYARQRAAHGCSSFQNISIRCRHP